MKIGQWSDISGTASLPNTVSVTGNSLVCLCLLVLDICAQRLQVLAHCEGSPFSHLRCLLALSSLQQEKEGCVHLQHFAGKGGGIPICRPAGKSAQQTLTMSSPARSRDSEQLATLTSSPHHVTQSKQHLMSKRACDVPPWPACRPPPCAAGPVQSEAQPPSGGWRLPGGRCPALACRHGLGGHERGGTHQQVRPQSRDQGLGPAQQPYS